MVFLARAECLALLRRTHVGRLVYTRDALPDVRPVNFALHGDDVVFRLRGESRLAAAVDGTVVAFEADEVDQARQTGWSVVVTGRAEQVPPEHVSPELAAVLPRPWAPGPHDLVMRLRPALVNGRRLT